VEGDKKEKAAPITLRGKNKEISRKYGDRKKKILWKKII